MRIRVSDAIVIAAAVFLAHSLRFGTEEVYLAASIHDKPTYAFVSVGLAVAWYCLLIITRSRSPRIVGGGAEEYRRVLSATVYLFACLGMGSLILQINLGRIYLAIALAAGLTGLMISRWTLRRVLRRGRKYGRNQNNVVVVGSRKSVESIVRSFDRNRKAGYSVVGACVQDELPEDGDTIEIRGVKVPILGGVDSLLTMLPATAADAVVLAASEHFDHDQIRELSWALERFDVDLVVSPGVVDIAGPRVSITPLVDFPLVQVDKPQYHGATRFGKALFDRSMATAIVFALSPILLVTALMIKMSDRGPIFYRQNRVGLDGASFRMWKFRSMTPNADKILDVAKAREESNSVFFKSATDSRITPIGKVIRRTSIDELPQLFNVLLGEMSLVGPRPLLPGEGMEIQGFVERRRLVKPGMTGLWQVSGRSALSASERVRLDLYYVENWSMLQDVSIIAKTVSAVLKRDGAY